MHNLIAQPCLFRNLLVQGLACSETCLFRDLLVQILLVQGLEPYCTALLHSLIAQLYCTALLHSPACSETCLFRDLLVQKLACSETCLFKNLLVQGLEPYCTALLDSLIAQPYCTASCTALLNNLISYKGPNMYIRHLHIVHINLFQLTRILHNTGISRNRNAHYEGTRCMTNFV